MNHLIVEKLYIKTDATDAIQDIMINIMRDMPIDLRICLIAGCQIDTELISSSNGNKTLRIRTRYPISILKDDKGNPISVVEMNPSNPNYPKK